MGHNWTNETDYFNSIGSLQGEWQWLLVLIAISLSSANRIAIEAVVVDREQVEVFLYARTHAWSIVVCGCKYKECVPHERAAPPLK